jgi:N-acetylmuramoyl-L-alanine amidase
VVIDPGHGGDDPGAIGVDGVCEKWVTIAIAQLVYLKALDHPELRVVLSRRHDEYVSPAERILAANRIGADTYVSIHANAFSSGSVSGIETLAHESEGLDSASYRLAKILQRHLVTRTGAKDRGVSWVPLFIRQAQMPAALVEVGFLTNRLEAKQLQSLSYQSKIADAILDAILEFL